MRQLVIKRNLYSGMTLVEIMIALVLSLVLIGGIITVFIANKATFRSQEGLAQLQENGRMALSILTNDIRNAGYGGCDFQKAIITNTLNNSNNYVWNFTNFIDGFESTSTSAWEPALDVSISGATPSPDGAYQSDVFTIRYVMDSDGRVIQHNNSNGNLRITGIAGDNLQVGSILLVSNCERGAIFQVSTRTLAGGSTYYLVKNLVNGGGTSMTPGNSTRDLGSRYLDASVARLGTRTYFIANSGFDDNVSALWRIDNAADPVELLQGVENLQISYGVDTNGDRVVDNYVAANAVGSWANVSSVRLNILISSLSDNVVNLGGNKQTYIFNGEDVTATDYRLRKEFTTTVAIRNLLQ